MLRQSFIGYWITITISEKMAYSASLMVKFFARESSEMDPTVDKRLLHNIFFPDVDPNQEWMERALCKYHDHPVVQMEMKKGKHKSVPEMFHPQRGKNGHSAKRVCGQCPVRNECLEYAIESNLWLEGIWGGKSYREIRKIRKERKSQ